MSIMAPLQTLQPVAGGKHVGRRWTTANPPDPCSLALNEFYFFSLRQTCKLKLRLTICPGFETVCVLFGTKNTWRVLMGDQGFSPDLQSEGWIGI
jgi:hypothetical protein